jgi:hypothetical protein
MKINQIVTEDSHKHAYHELKAGMEKWMDNWDPKLPQDCRSLEEYTGSDYDEVEENIQDNWLPQFDDDKDALIRALYKIQDIYEDTIISDFCLQYLQVLGAE